MPKIHKLKCCKLYFWFFNLFNLCVPDEGYLVDNPKMDSINILQGTNINNSNNCIPRKIIMITRVL
jgi:hypothetical protein